MPFEIASSKELKKDQYWNHLWHNPWTRHDNLRHIHPIFARTQSLKIPYDSSVVHSPICILPTHLRHANPPARLSTISTVILYAAPPVHLPVHISADRLTHRQTSLPLSRQSAFKSCANPPAAHLHAWLLTWHSLEMIPSDMQSQFGQGYNLHIHIIILHTIQPI